MTESSTPNSTPKRLEELAAGYVVGNLDPEEAEEFRQLLQENPELVTQVNLLDDLLGDVLYTLLDKLSVPADLYDDLSGLIVTLEPSPASQSQWDL